MQIVRKINTKIFSKGMLGDDTLKLKFDEYSKLKIKEFIDTGAHCITIYSSLSEFKSDISSIDGYTTIDPINCAGTIKAFDEETLELTLDIDDRYFTQGSHFYIEEEDWENYELCIRSLFDMSAGAGEEEGLTIASMVNLIGFDLIRKGDN